MEKNRIDEICQIFAKQISLYHFSHSPWTFQIENYGIDNDDHHTISFIVNYLTQYNSNWDVRFYDQDSQWSYSSSSRIYVFLKECPCSQHVYTKIYNLGNYEEKWHNSPFGQWVDREKEFIVEEQYGLFKKIINWFK
jgi:hypothetical protein